MRFGTDPARKDEQFIAQAGAERAAREAGYKSPLRRLIEAVLRRGREQGS